MKKELSIPFAEIGYDGEPQGSREPHPWESALIDKLQADPRFTVTENEDGTVTATPKASPARTLQQAAIARGAIYMHASSTKLEAAVMAFARTLQK